MQKVDSKAEDLYTWDDAPKIFIFNEEKPGRIKMHTKRLDLRDWVRIDKTYIDQMKLRHELILQKRDLVFKTNPSNQTDACKWELFHILTHYLPERFPDKFELRSECIYNKVLKESISILKDDPDDPMIRIGKLTQEDWIIMEWNDSSSSYTLTAGLLCFPSHWWLYEKFEKGITQIHQPVKVFIDYLNIKVQTLLRKMKPETPMWRANWGLYNDLDGLLDLYAPPTDKSFVSIFDSDKTGEEIILREEYQTLRKLPDTKCIVFSIRYYQRYLKEFSDFPINDCVALLKAIENLDANLYEYKGGACWGDAATKYLRYIIKKRERNLSKAIIYLRSYAWFFPVAFAFGVMILLRKAFNSKFYK